MTNELICFYIVAQGSVKYCFGDTARVMAHKRSLAPMQRLQSSMKMQEMDIHSKQRSRVRQTARSWHPFTSCGSCVILVRPAEAFSPNAASTLPRSPWSRCQVCRQRKHGSGSLSARHEQMSRRDRVAHVKRCVDIQVRPRTKRGRVSDMTRKETPMQREKDGQWTSSFVPHHLSHTAAVSDGKVLR